jgi:tripeptidyl-peptidase-1
MAPTKTLLLIFTGLVSCVWTTAHATYVIHEQREEPVGVDVIRNRVHPDTLLPIRIALRPNNHASSNAEAWLKAVSDPDSTSFGQFWTQEDVIEAFKPAEHTVDALKSWLSSEGIEHITHSDNKQWLAFDLPARHAETMLKTSYFESVLENGRIEISCNSYMLPMELQAHVDFVKP